MSSVYDLAEAQTRPAGQMVRDSEPCGSVERGDLPVLLIIDEHKKGHKGNRLTRGEVVKNSRFILSYVARGR